MAVEIISEFCILDRITNKTKKYLVFTVYPLSLRSFPYDAMDTHANYICKMFCFERWVLIKNKPLCAGQSQRALGESIHSVVKERFQTKGI